MTTQKKKELLNYIHNDLGITKEEIHDLIIDVIKKEVSKVVSNQSYIEGLISKEILRQIRYEDDKHNRNFYVLNTMDSIYNRIDQEIHKIVCDRLQITLKDPKENDTVQGLEDDIDIKTY